MKVVLWACQAAQRFAVLNLALAVSPYATLDVRQEEAQCSNSNVTQGCQLRVAAAFTAALNVLQLPGSEARNAPLIAAQISMQLWCSHQ
jgi:hypothetical protein